MKIVVAPNGFKGSLTAVEAAAAIAAGLRAALPAATIVEVPLADGGEGTCATLVQATGGALRHTRVTGPLGEPVDATWGVLGDGQTAVIEMAAAAGLGLVPPARRDPTRTTTHGVGELIAAARDAGCERILLGLGGSATCDAGAGLAQALGARLRSSDGRDLPRGGRHLALLDRIEASALPALELTAACDVDNPLCGERGAAAVYGPQKGATPEQVALLDAALDRFAQVAARDLGRDVRDLPGAGAAGGLGAGLVAFFGATLQPGTDLVLEAVGLRGHLVGADLLVTGEGRLDAQTLHHKAPLGALRVAQELGVRVAALCGRVDAAARDALIAAGFETIRPAAGDDVPDDVALREARARLVAAATALGEELT